MSDPIKQWKKENPVEWEMLCRVSAFLRCVICEKPFSRSRLRALDHRHIDGLVRGVPCAQCNEWLGANHDDADKLRRAADYLDNPPALGVIGLYYIPGSVGAYHLAQALLAFDTDRAQAQAQEIDALWQDLGGEG